MQILKYGILSFLLQSSVPTAPEVTITCGTDVSIDEAEIRAVACPEGFVGQWSQERPAGSCDWQPTEPRWWSCSRIINPPVTNEPPVDPDYDEHSPTGPGEGPPGAKSADKPRP